MFGESMLITSNSRIRPKRWLTIAASLFIHSFFVAAMIITPLMDADTGMPTLSIETLFLSTPPPPTLPPPPVGGHGTGQETTEAGVITENRPASPSRSTTEILVAPADVPDDIPQEMPCFGFEEADSPGIVGAAVGWSEEVNPLDISIITGKTNSLKPETVSTNVPMTIIPPKLLRRITPDYPALALRAHIEGTVVVHAETDVYGKVIRSQAVQGHPLLLQAAEQAVAKWLYEPYIINGIPRPVKFIVELNFTLNNQ